MDHLLGNDNIINHLIWTSFSNKFIAKSWFIENNYFSYDDNWIKQLQPTKHQTNKSKLNKQIQMEIMDEMQQHQIMSRNALYAQYTQEQLVNPQQHFNLGGNGLDIAHAVLPLEDGRLLVVGTSESQNGLFLNNRGGKDIFIALWDVVLE